MKRYFLAAGLMALTCAARATVIEGFTPSGKFKTVGVSEAGRFLVETTSTNAHVIIDGGQQGAVAVTIQGVKISSVVTGQFVVGIAASTCYPADTARMQGTLCNSSDSALIYFGDATTLPATWATLNPGTCYVPDGIGRFTASLECISTATASGFFVYHK